jgi:hypothetical protein
MLFIAELLGVPEGDRPELRALFTQMGAPGGMGKQPPNRPLWFLEDLFQAYVQGPAAPPS